MIDTLIFPHPGTLLPHGKPILQIDAITSYVPGNYLIAEKQIDGDNPFLEGHFPGYPLMPGVILIEMMFQACGLYGRMEERQFAAPGKEPVKKMGKAIKIDEAIFKMEVKPPSALTIKVVFVHKLLSFSIFKATIHSGEKLAASASITVHL